MYNKMFCRLLNAGFNYMIIWYQGQNAFCPSFDDIRVKEIIYKIIHG